MITEEKILNENNVGKWDSWYKNLPDEVIDGYGLDMTELFDSLLREKFW